MYICGVVIQSLVWSLCVLMVQVSTQAAVLVLLQEQKAGHQQTSAALCPRALKTLPKIW